MCNVNVFFCLFFEASYFLFRFREKSSFFIFQVCGVETVAHGVKPPEEVEVDAEVEVEAEVDAEVKVIIFAPKAFVQ